MDPTLATPLLGGLAPTAFMRRHWQKKPLLIRAAEPEAGRVVTRSALFELAGREQVESRLVRRGGRAGWTLREGPFARRSLPTLGEPGWTLLVQGVDLHLPAARDLLARFRFLPDARLDDLMVSYASDGGGVGPHVDSYDVFLLQLQGGRRWQVAAPGDSRLQTGLPLKILAGFRAEHEWLLAPGDMLYVPPGWGHDGVAEGECLTASIGFRAPARDEFGRDILQKALDGEDPEQRGPLYRDPRQPATDEPARIPAALHAFGAQAVQRLLGDRAALDCAVGEVLSEPKPGVCFDPPADAPVRGSAKGLCLDRRTRMLYDERFVFINGESFRATGRDARLMRMLADRRRLGAREVGLLSAGARELLGSWQAAGWLHDEPGAAP